jgi:hypothetical protein
MARKPGDLAEERLRRRRRRVVSASEIIDFLEYLAPPSLSSPEEPYGLQVGSPSAEIKTVVVAPMASYNALSLAASRKQVLLLTAAPLVTEPMMQIRRDNPIGAKLAYLMEHRLNLYSLANSYAAAPGGFDDSLAEALGLAATSALKPTAYEPQYKLAVFTPPAAVNAVLCAAAEAGAGRVGNYSYCSFQSEGKGTFQPREGARPTVGTVGRLERVDEVRLELIVSQRELQGVIAAILDAHPYEEVAYDVYAVKNPGVYYGRGRIGELPLQVALDTVLAQVQDVLGVESVRCSHRPEFPIASLAAASGISDGLFWQANRAGAGALVTGGATLQDLMLADNSTTVVIDIGYAASVTPGLRRLCNQLRNTFASDGLEIVYSG